VNSALNALLKYIFLLLISNTHQHTSENHCQVGSPPDMRLGLGICAVSDTRNYLVCWHRSEWLDHSYAISLHTHQYLKLNAIAALKKKINIIITTAHKIMASQTSDQCILLYTTFTPMQDEISSLNLVLQYVRSS